MGDSAAEWKKTRGFHGKVCQCCASYFAIYLQYANFSEKR